MKRGRKRKFSKVNKVRLIDLYHNYKLKMSEIEILLDMTYPTILKSLEYHSIPIRPKDLVWNEQARREHGVLLREIYAQARCEKKKNGNVKTNPRNEGTEQKGRSVFD